jgi:hypothetical protein
MANQNEKVKNSLNLTSNLKFQIFVKITGLRTAVRQLANMYFDQRISTYAIAIRYRIAYLFFALTVREFKKRIVLYVVIFSCYSYNLNISSTILNTISILYNLSNYEIIRKQCLLHAYLHI